MQIVHVQYNSCCSPEFSDRRINKKYPTTTSKLLFPEGYKSLRRSLLKDKNEKGGLILMLYFNKCIYFVAYCLQEVVSMESTRLLLTSAAHSLAPAIEIDLTGEWRPEKAAFLWQSANLFRREVSDDPNDYWVAYAAGGCLTSYSRYAAARLHPEKNTLNFGRKATQALDGPWTLLWVPHSPTAPSTEEGGGGSEELKMASYAVLLTKRDMDFMIRSHPEVFEPTTHQWIDIDAARHAIDNMYQFHDNAMILHSSDRATATRDQQLGHGATFRPQMLLEIDRNTSLSADPSKSNIPKQLLY